MYSSVKQLMTETVLHEIRKRVDENPQAIAIKVAPGDIELTYERFWEICADAKIPKCRGVACLALSNSGLDLCLMQIVFLLRGLTIVHMDPADPRLEQLLDDCNPSIIVINSEATHERVSKTGKELIVIHSREVLSPLLSQSHGSTQPTSKRLSYPVETVTDASTCSIYYTSGSTGLPKGCVLDHDAVLSYSITRNEVHGINCSSKVLLASAATFDPCLGDTLGTFCAGACLVVPQQNNVSSFLGVTNFEREILEKFQVTHCQCTPGFWAAATGGNKENTCPVNRLGYAGLEALALGGESLERFWPLRGKFQRLINTYGVTECYCYQTYQELSASSSPEDIRSIGLPYPGNTIFLVPDEDLSKDGNEKFKNMVKVDGTNRDVNLDPESTHMIVIGGKQLGTYLNRPIETTRRFVVHDGVRYYNTGDIGSVDSKGRLLIKGRKDFQVKIAGTRVELEEIEAGIQKTCLVESVTCVLVENAKREKILVACSKIQVGTSSSSSSSSASKGVLTGEDSASNDNDDLLLEGNAKLQMMLTFTLRQACKQWLPAKIVPKEWLFFQKSLPRTPNDKIDRNALADIWRNQSAKKDVGNTKDGENACEENDAQQQESNLSREEEFVGNAWRDELGLPEGSFLDKCDNFFDLGGDSLSALRLCRRLLALLFPKDEVVKGIVNDFGDIKRDEFTVNSLYKHPTLKAYAQNVFSNMTLADENSSCNAGLASKNSSLTKESSREADAAANGASDTVSPDAIILEEKKSSEEKQPDAVPSSAAEEWLFDDTATRHLFVAVQHNLSPFVTTLVQDLKANPNGWLQDTKSKCKKDKEKRPLTPLHVASSHGFTEITKTLVDHESIKVGLQEKHGVLPFFIAKTVDVFELIHQKQPHLITAKDDNRQTVLHFMSRSGNHEILKHILFDGNNKEGLWPKNKFTWYNSAVDWRDRWHRTPISWAILNSHTKCVELLLQGKSDVNAKIKEKQHKKDSRLPNESALELAQRINFPLKEIMVRVAKK